MATLAHHGYCGMRTFEDHGPEAELRASDVVVCRLPDVMGPEQRADASAIAGLPGLIEAARAVLNKQTAAGHYIVDARDLEELAAAVAACEGRGGK